MKYQFFDRTHTVNKVIVKMTHQFIALALKIGQFTYKEK